MLDGTQHLSIAYVIFHVGKCYPKLGKNIIFNVYACTFVWLCVPRKKFQLMSSHWVYVSLCVCVCVCLNKWRTTERTLRTGHWMLNFCSLINSSVRLCLHMQKRFHNTRISPNIWSKWTYVFNFFFQFSFFLHFIRQWHWTFFSML